MVTLKGKQIYLRALEPEDLDFVHAIENDESIWHLSHTQTPYSNFLIKQYLEAAHKDIYEAKQLRLVISNYKNQALGMIDIFDFDFLNKRAGIGILVRNETDRGKGVGSEALQLVIKYSFTHLQLHQLYCNISEDNKVSLKLFTKHGFETIGLKKDWTWCQNRFHNEFLLQLINTDVP
jgi:diamine N-acetyltransferase